MTFVIPNWETMLPIWEHQIFLLDWDKTEIQLYTAIIT